MCVHRSVGHLGSDWLLGSLRGLNLLLRSTQGLRPGLNYVAPSGLVFCGELSPRPGLAVRQRSSIECCGVRSSRFAFPTFRTGRERWGVRHFWLVEVSGSGPNIRHKNAEILRWESCASRATPLPQDDTGCGYIAREWGRRDVQRFLGNLSTQLKVGSEWRDGIRYASFGSPRSRDRRTLFQGAK